MTGHTRCTCAENRLFAAVLVLALAVSAVLGQETARVPRTYVVNGSAPEADDAGPGTAESPLRTIGAAAALAQPGDTVLVRAGVYREWVSPARGGQEGRPITYLAAPGESVTIKGSDIWTDWRPYGPEPDVLIADIGNRFDGRTNPYLTGISIAPRDARPAARPAKDPDRMPRTLGQVFVDGLPLIEAGSVSEVLAHPGTWVVTADGRQIVAHLPPSPAPSERRLIEVSARERVFAPRRRGLGFIHVQGFTIEHCANQGPFPQGGALSPRSGRNWVIEYNTIRFAKTVGMDVGNETWEPQLLRDTAPEDKVRMSGGGHVVRRNVITDNGLCGIAGWQHRGAVIVENIVERNNRLDFSSLDAEWEEWAGIKLHGDGAFIAGNLIRDNEAFGIWLDNGYNGARITRNVILNNRMAGVFVELGDGPCLIDTNVIACTRPRGDFSGGMGVYAHDASGVTVAHNLILGNAGGGVVMRTVTDRKVAGSPVETSRERIANNVIWDNQQAAIDLPLPGPRSAGNESDYNLLSGAHGRGRGLLRPWPALFALNQFKSTAGDEEVALTLTEAFEKAKLPAAERPDVAVWRRNPVLSLPQWRAVTGMDGHSREEPTALSLLLRPREPTLTISAGNPLLEMRCPKVEGVACDFLGRPLPEGTVQPGPFQGLTATRTDIILWPVLGPPSPPERPTQGPKHD